MVNPFIEMFCTFGGLFGLCEFGERLRLAFDEINSMLNLKTKWYLLPLKAQKILSIMLIVTERPRCWTGHLWKYLIQSKHIQSGQLINYLWQLFVDSSLKFRFPTKHIHRSWCFSGLAIEFMRVFFEICEKWTQQTICVLFSIKCDFIFHFFHVPNLTSLVITIISFYLLSNWILLLIQKEKESLIERDR